jgi:hypothetical protein
MGDFGFTRHVFVMHAGNKKRTRNVFWRASPEKRKEYNYYSIRDVDSPVNLEQT